MSMNESQFVRPISFTAVLMDSAILNNTFFSFQRIENNFTNVFELEITIANKNTTKSVQKLACHRDVISGRNHARS